MEQNEFQQLIHRHLAGSLSVPERNRLRDLLRDPENERQLDAIMDEQLEASTVSAEEYDLVTRRIRERLLKNVRPAAKVRNIRPWLVAASVILLFGAGIYFMQQQRSGKTVTQVVKDIAPGHQGAILTLADGSQVVLDSLKNGIVAQQNGTQVILKDGQLAYDPSGKHAESVLYNTVTIPKGRQFHLQLPDGTVVWLNSASSIRYPTAFPGKERRVTITGEAYFEVAKNTNMPFHVNVNNRADVQVLGTHFNIRAYEDDADIVATLLEGAVRVSAAGQAQTLKPGQQASVHADKKISVMNDADLNQVVAWKNGLFNFDGLDVKTAMKEIGRWYDLEIIYQSEPDAGLIMGEMQRDLTLSQVMHVLGGLEVQYKLEGRKLIIIK